MTHNSSQTPNGSAGPEKAPAKKSFIPWLIAAICVLAICLCAIFYISSPSKAGEEIEQRTITLTDVGFDTPVTFRTTSSEEDFNEYLGILKDTFIECNKLFDPYNDYDGVTSLKAVNEQAAEHPVEVDEKVIEVYQDALAAQKINPKFDVAQGKLIEVWKEARDASTPYLPDPSAIENSINKQSTGGVTIKENTISFDSPNVALDFGAIAKGYTAQLAAQRLKEAGMEYGYINAGGNVVLIGEKLDGKPWKVGIQDPNGPDSLVIYTTQTPTCLVTSGDYQRYMTVDGKNYSHIIDPQSGYPETYMRSVTVINEDSAYCDAMSTALFCMPVEEGIALCEKLGLQAVWIADRGTVDRAPDLQTDTLDVYMTSGIRSDVALKASK